MKIKYSTNFQVSKAKEGRGNQGQIATEKEINCFPVLFSIFDLVTTDNTFYMNFKGFKPIKFPGLKKNCSSFLSFCSDHKDTVLNRLVQNEVDITSEHFDFFKEKKKLFNSLIDVSTKFENIHSRVLHVGEKNYVYNLIEVEKIEVLAHKENSSQLFYMIRLNDKNALFISELNSQDYQSEPNLCQYFYKIYSKLEPIKEETKNKILIPAFKINYKQQYICPNVMPSLAIEKEMESYEISRFFEYTDISMDYDLDYESAVYKAIDPQEAYCIKNGFIFGILNYDILSELNIPTSFITYVHKESWKEI